MALGRLWAGTAYGTNTGNLFVKLEGDDSALSGILRLNDTGVGLVAYSIAGSFDGALLAFSGEPQQHAPGVVVGRLQATAVLTPEGTLRGEWSTDTGAAGTFVLHPHDLVAEKNAADEQPAQIHIARHPLGAIEIDREQIVSLAEDIQRDFPKGSVAVIVTAGTEQARYLEEFKRHRFTAERAEIVKIVAQEPESSGINKMVVVEFGPHVNYAMAQGSSEAWALGERERLKRDLGRFERTYATNFKRLGYGIINQLLIAAAIVFLPSLGSLPDRAILMGGVLALSFAVNWLHGRYLPFAAIYLDKKPTTLVARVSPSVLSWLIAATAGLVAALLAAYLQGTLQLPGGP